MKVYHIWPDYADMEKNTKFKHFFWLSTLKYVLFTHLELYACYAFCLLILVGVVAFDITCECLCCIFYMHSNVNILH
jgi:hypothetical protein